MHETTSKAPELKGRYVVLLILALTAVVGSFFIYLGPKATSKTPGIVHVGVRFLNEQTIDFLKYGKKGPPATIEFINAAGKQVYEMEDLKLGRNLIPLDNIPSGPYTVRVSSTDFETAELPIVVEGRMLNPPSEVEFTPGTYADYNMIGVRLKPKEKQDSNSSL